MHFETRTGVGNLWSGGTLVLPNVPYRLDISREFRGGTPGLWRVAGQIDAPGHELMGLVIANPDDLELELEDGTRWGCVLQNSDGRLLNSGKKNLPVPT
jgi:hypothetical protein